MSSQWVDWDPEVTALTGDDLDNTIDLYNDLNRHDLAESCPDDAYLETLGEKHDDAEEGLQEVDTSVIDLTGEADESLDEGREQSVVARSNKRGHSAAFSVGGIASSIEGRTHPQPRGVDSPPSLRQRRASHRGLNGRKLVLMCLKHHSYHGQ